jgi:hypothetical protein
VRFSTGAPATFDDDQHRVEHELGGIDAQAARRVRRAFEATRL